MSNKDWNLQKQPDNPPDAYEDQEELEEVFTREDFKQYCIDNWFIDDDGCGYYMDQNHGKTHIVCMPSEIANGIEHPYPYVVWYNK